MNKDPFDQPTEVRDIFGQFSKTVPEETPVQRPVVKEQPVEQPVVAPQEQPGIFSRLKETGKNLKEINKALEVGAARGFSQEWFDEYLSLQPAMKKYLEAGFSLEEAKKAIAEELPKIREQQKALEEAHPYATGVGKFVGSIPPMLVAPVGKGAKWLYDVGYGGLFGGLTGAGEAEEDKATAGAWGAGLGAGTTAAFLGVGKGLKAAYDRTLKPGFSALNAYFRPQAAAEKKLINTLIQDQQDIAAGKLQGIDWDQWTKLRDNGEPVTIADLGGPRTQALIKDLVKNDPEKAAQLTRFFEDRFKTQYERIGNDIRYITGSEANAGKTSDQILAEYDAKRFPAYQKAYSNPNAEFMYDKELQNYVNSFKDPKGSSKFISDAIRNGYDEAVKQAVFNNRPRPEYYSLEHWDYIRREISKDSGAWKKAEELNKILDAKVPEYKEARGLVTNYFGEKNALEAGQRFAEKKIRIEDLQKTLRKMSPEELELFREGYASNLSNNVIKNIKEGVDVNNALFGKPAQKEQLLAVFGEEGLNKIKDRMTVESIYQNTNKAFKIPASSYKDFILAGLTGGAITGYESGWDPGFIIGGVSAGAFLKKALAQEMTKRGVKFLNRESADILSRLLTSQDPADMRKAYDLLSKNPQARTALQSFSNAMQRAAALAVSQEATKEPQEKMERAPWLEKGQEKLEPAPWLQGKARGGSVTDKMHMANGGSVPFTGSSNPKRVYDKSIKDFVTAEDKEKDKSVTEKMVKAKSREKSDIPYLPDEGYLKAVKQFEGFTPKAKWDIKQHSVGYGTRARYPGEEITREEAERRFRDEMQHAGSLVNKFKYDMPEPWKAALTSLTFNAGSAWMDSGLGEAVKKGDWNKARNIFLTYNKAEGKVNEGLRNRRIAEMKWLAQQPKTQVAQGQTPAILQSRPETDQVQLARMSAEAARSAAQPTPEDQAALTNLVKETATVPEKKKELSPEDYAKFLQAIQGFMKNQEKLPAPVAPMPQAPKPEIPIVRPYGMAQGGTVTDRMHQARKKKEVGGSATDDMTWSDVAEQYKKNIGPDVEKQAANYLLQQYQAYKDPLGKIKEVTEPLQRAYQDPVGTLKGAAEGAYNLGKGAVDIGVGAGSKALGYLGYEPTGDVKYHREQPLEQAVQGVKKFIAEEPATATMMATPAALSAAGLGRKLIMSPTFGALMLDESGSWVLARSAAQKSPAIKERYEKAVKMASEGADRDAIWKETAIKKDPTGNWLAEVSDEAAKLKVPIVEKPKYMTIPPDFPTEEQAKLVFGSGTYENRVKLHNEMFYEWLKKKEIYEREAYKEHKGKLKDILHHPELFELVPELQDIETTFRQAPIPTNFGFGSLEGFYNPETKEMFFSGDTPKVALHEAGHIISNVQNRPQGGNKGMFYPPEKIAEEAQKNYNMLKDVVRMKDVESQIKEGKKSFEDLKSFYEKVGPPEYLEAVKKLSNSIDENTAKKWKEKLDYELNTKPYESYKRLLDEAYSRNTEARMGLTMEERKENPPWKRTNETEIIPGEPKYGTWKSTNPYGYDVPEEEFIIHPPKRESHGGSVTEKMLWRKKRSKKH